MAEYNELLEDLKTIVSDEIQNQWKKYCERKECHSDGLFRWDYNKNVEKCKTIDGCLFSWNCNKYNDMIEEDCE